MKIGKKNLFISFVILILIISFLMTHSLGFDSEIKDYVDSMTSAGTYDLISMQLIMLLVYMLAALFILQIWNIIIGALTPKLTRTTLNTLNVVGRMTIIPFCAIAYLNTFPAFQGTLLGISAILGTAIGFASTNTIGNFLAGLYIMAARPFLIGDYIILPDSKDEGRVKEITVNYTKITLPSGNTKLIGNNKFLSASIINTRVLNSEKRRFVYPLIWGTNSDDETQWFQEAIEKTVEVYSARLLAPIEWFIVSRNRLDRTYQISLTTDSATKILSLSSDFMTTLTTHYDAVRRKAQLPA